MQDVIKQPTIWNVKKLPHEEVEELAYELRVPIPAAKVYYGRGLDTPEKVKDFAKLAVSKLHNPWLLPDIVPVIERLEKALDNNEKIFVWGDYDVDGVTSTSVVVTTLRKLNANMAYHVPHRIADGYDVKTASVDKALEANADLLISVDCGIVAFEAATYAKEKGLDLIITDHHHPSDDGRIPNCIGVINPNRDDPAYPGEKFASHAKEGHTRYPFDGLAGVGIAFKVMMCLGQKRGLNTKELMCELLEYVALGTVADVAPMIDENRSLVHLGCQSLGMSAKPGIRELLKVADVKTVSTLSIGFHLGPRINAVGRLADSTTALDLMIENNETRAKALAMQLDTANRRRQSQQEQVVEEAIALVEETADLENDYIIVIGAKGWHPGLVGLVAGKLAEKYKRPALVCTIKDDGYAKGSCRSTREFNILNALKSPIAWEYFKKRADGSVVCGGHAFAAGFELPAENLSALRKALNDYAKDQKAILQDEIQIDATIQAGDITVQTYDAIMRMAPFGQGNEQPIFLTKNMEVLECKLLKEKHLKFKLKGKTAGSNWISALAWRLGPDIDLYPAGSHVDVVYEMGMEEFQGRTSLNITLKDIKRVN